MAKAGAAVLPCGKPDPCAAPWARVQGEVAHVDSMKDIRARNKVISASYARLYQQAPDLKWAGTAAFASKQVGCGMDVAAGVPGAGSSRDVLGAGNLAVYDELYPALRFYQQNKATMTKAQILACMDHKPGDPLDPSIKRGLVQTMNGDGAGGAMTMLHHEQYDTLQESVYDQSWMFRRGLNVAKATGWPSMKLAFSAACETSDPGKIVDFRDYRGQLYNPEDRWPFAQEAANRFVKLAGNPASAADIARSLEQIAHAAPAP